MLEGHSGPLKDMAIAANGSVVVTASEDGTARAWDLVSAFPPLSDIQSSVVPLLGDLTARSIGKLALLPVLSHCFQATLWLVLADIMEVKLEKQHPILTCLHPCLACMQSCFTTRFGSPCFV